MSFSWYYNMFELKCTLELRHLYFNLAAFHFLTTFNVIYALFTQKDVGIEESHILQKTDYRFDQYFYTSPIHTFLLYRLFKIGS